MPKTPEERFNYYWKNAERIREHTRVYGYQRRGLPVPEKRVYKLRSFEEREAARKAGAEAAARKAAGEAPKRVRKPKPEVAAPEVSFTLSNKDFQ